MSEPKKVEQIPVVPELTPTQKKLKKIVDIDELIDQAQSMETGNKGFSVTVRGVNPEEKEELNKPENLEAYRAFREAFTQIKKELAKDRKFDPKKAIKQGAVEARMVVGYKKVRGKRKEITKPVIIGFSEGEKTIKLVNFSPEVRKAIKREKLEPEYQIHPKTHDIVGFPSWTNEALEKWAEGLKSELAKKLDEWAELPPAERRIPKLEEIAKILGRIIGEKVTINDFVIEIVDDKARIIKEDKDITKQVA